MPTIHETLRQMAIEAGGPGSGRKSTGVANTYRVLNQSGKIIRRGLSLDKATSMRKKAETRSGNSISYRWAVEKEGK